MQYENSESNKRYGYLSSEIEAAYHEASLRLGLSDSAMRILYALCFDGTERLLSDIIRLSGISKQTINSSLRKLEQDGIVYLEMVDHRKKRVCLTEKGRDFAQNSVMKILKIENEIFDSWSKADQDKYMQLTEQFLIAFREKTKELET